MVAYEETSSLQVLGTVTADAVITITLALLSFDGSLHDALFPPGLPGRNALAACLFDVLLMLLARAAISVSSVTGVCTRPISICLAFACHSAMAIWMATKAVFAIRAVDEHLDINIPGSDAKIHVWWLNITLIMSAVFGFAEHSLCVAWAATFRGERWIELSHYGGSTFSNAPTRLPQADQPGIQGDVEAAEPLLSGDSGLAYP
jgi:hypothetical protein